MILNDFVETEKKRLVQKYKEYPEERRQDFEIEERMRRDYKSREILELLQNAVDELEMDENEIKIELSGDIFSISNTGNPFSKAGIKSFLTAFNSGKMNQIGNKGLGFRAVLNWSDSISIYSEGLSIRFSPKYSKRFFSENGIADPTATMSAPEVIPPVDTGHYATTIEIAIKKNTTKENVKENVVAQINNIDAVTLLFVSKNQKLKGKTLVLETVVDGKSTKWIRTESSNVITVLKSGEESKSWVTYSKRGRTDDGTYEVIVAHDPEVDTEANKLISYFETDIDMPIKWLVHASLEMTEDRNRIVKDDVNNAIVLEEVAKLLCSSAEKIRTKKVPWLAFDSIIPEGRFPNILDINGKPFGDVFYDYLKTKKILPTINGDFVSIGDNPIFYKYRLTEFLQTEGSHVLQHSDNPARNEKINKFSSHLPFIQVSRIIKRNLQDMSVNERCACAIALYYSYRYVDDNSFDSKIAPRFFYDEHEKQIPNGAIMLPPFDADESDEVFTAPDFASIRILHHAYLQALVDELNHFYEENKNEYWFREKHLWSAYSLKDDDVCKAYGFNTFTKDNFVELIEKQLHSARKNKPTMFGQYLRWLMKYSDYQPKVFLSRAGTVEEVNELYLGKEYGGDCLETVFQKSDEKFVAGLEMMDCDDLDAEACANYLLGVGVADSPRVIWIDVEKDNLPEEYVDMVIDNIRPFDSTYNVGRIDSPDKFRSNLYFGTQYPNKVMLRSAISLDGFDTILANRDTLYILSLLADNTNLIEATDEHACMNYYKRVGNSGGSTYVGVYSFALFRLRTTQWIKIGDSYYAPNQIVFHKGIKDTIPGIIGCAKSDIFPEGINIERWKQDEIISRLGIASKLSELPEERIYDLLMELPETDPSGEVSRTLYRQIIQEGNVEAPSSGIPSNFIENGLVYCKGRGYVRIDKCYYTQYAIPRVIENEHSLINISRKQSPRRIKNWFGVDELRIDYRIAARPAPHPLNDLFQRDVAYLKIALLAQNIDTWHDDTNKNKTKRLSLILCKEIVVSMNGIEKPLDEYRFALHDGDVNTHYISIPQSIKYIEELRGDVDFQNAVTEIIETFYNLTDVTFLEKISRLVSQSNEAKKRIVELQYDSIDNWNEAADILGFSSEKYMREEFADYASRNIRKLRDLRNAMRSHYIIALYTEYENDPDAQPDYLDKVNRFDTVDFYDYAIPSDESFDAKAFLIDMFPILGSVIDENKDIQALGRATKEKLRDRFPDNGGDLELFLQIRQFDSILRFGRYDDIATAFQKYLAEKDMRARKEQQEMANESLEYEVVDISIGLTRNLSDTSLTESGRLRRSGRKQHSAERDKRNRKQGKKAERIALKYLRENGFDDVEWLSAFACEDNANLDGSDTYGYDIRCKQNDRIKYVEVKSTVGDVGDTVSFSLTEKEYAKAKEYLNDYNIVHVQFRGKKHYVRMLPGLFSGKYADVIDEALESIVVTVPISTIE